MNHRRARLRDSRQATKHCGKPVYLATLSSVESAIEIKIDFHSDSGVYNVARWLIELIISADCDAQIDAI